MSMHGGSHVEAWWFHVVEKKTELYAGITIDLENTMGQHGQPAPLVPKGPIPKADALKERL